MICIIPYDEYFNFLVLYLYFDVNNSIEVKDQSTCSSTADMMKTSPPLCVWVSDCESVW